MGIERRDRGRKSGAILLLVVAGVLAGAPPATAQNPPTMNDLVGTWDIKDKNTNTLIATIDLRQDGQFEMTVRSRAEVRHPPNPKARWELVGSNLRVVYDPNGRGKQVYMRGKIDRWTANNRGAFFELPLREVNALPAKVGDVLVFDR